MKINYSIITSLLDSDLYKYTMQQLILANFPTERVSYQFINRGKNLFPLGFDRELKTQLQFLSNLSLTNEEKKWLEKIPYFHPWYIGYLSKYKFDPDNIAVHQTDGNLTLSINGRWHSTILFEVPLMAIISEIYFQMVGAKLNDDWEKRLENKAKNLQDSGCLWSDFGTRRRYSFIVQDRLIEIMKGCSGFIGTSNPHLAIKHNIKPVGTSAHEMIMGMAGLYGASLANRKYLDCWRNFYGNDLSIALTDTYTTDAFLKAFTFKDATEWGGLRQDSGDCDEWASKIINHYNKLEIPLEDKTLLFSDSLNDEKYKKLSLKYRNVARIVGGIGTDFSNYCSDKSPLNMVIKLTSINGTSVVKLSDDLKKSTGNVDSVRKIKEELNII